MSVHVNYLDVRRNYGNATQPPTSSGRKADFLLLLQYCQIRSTFLGFDDFIKKYMHPR